MLQFVRDNCPKESLSHQFLETVARFRFQFCLFQNSDFNVSLTTWRISPIRQQYKRGLRKELKYVNVKRNFSATTMRTVSCVFVVWLTTKEHTQGR